MINEKMIFNENGEKIFVETYIPKYVKSTIIFCHGITGCRKGRTIDDDYFQVLAKKLMEKNHKVVLFDFSGHGDSEGKDYDVCLSKSTKELERIVQEEVVDGYPIDFLAFSYGAAVLCNFLQRNLSINPQHIVFYSPCLFPLESCFLNADSIFGKDIVKDYESGLLEERGYAVVGAKNFCFGMQMIYDCQNFAPDYLKKFADRMLVLSGRDDVILDTQYNDDFCKKYNINQIYLEASHSLFEDIENAFRYTIHFFDSK